MSRFVFSVTGRSGSDGSQWDVSRLDWCDSIGHHPRSWGMSGSFRGGRLLTRWVSPLATGGRCSQLNQPITNCWIPLLQSQSPAWSLFKWPRTELRNWLCWSAFCVLQKVFSFRGEHAVRQPAQRDHHRPDLGDRDLPTGGHRSVRGKFHPEGDDRWDPHHCHRLGPIWGQLNCDEWWVFGTQVIYSRAVWDLALDGSVYARC